MFETDIRNQEAPHIKPAYHIRLKPEFSGCWVVLGDITGNGKMDFVTARNDNQVVTAVSSYTIDGDLLWTWGEANAGTAKLGYDVPLQLYDMDDKGYCDVFLSCEGNFVRLDGKTGEEIKRFDLPKGLRVADCICFANLTGGAKPTDIIIKSRYRQLWAYTKDWKLIWTWKPAGNRKTCHYPTLLDLDNDGLDEVFAGRKMLNNDGCSLWKIKTRKINKRGHLDAVRVVKCAADPKDTRIILTYCGGNIIAYVNGNGEVLWTDRKFHFESIDVGNFNPDYPAPQFYIDIDHTAYGESKGFFYDATGKRFGIVHNNYGRQHRAIDWTGDGNDDIVVGNELLIMNGKGEKIATLEFHSGDDIIMDQKGDRNSRCHMGIWDVSGKGNGDLVLYDGENICVYLNPGNTDKKHPHLEHLNFTFY